MSPQYPPIEIRLDPFPHSLLSTSQYLKILETLSPAMPAQRTLSSARPFLSQQLVAVLGTVVLQGRCKQPFAFRKGLAWESWGHDRNKSMSMQVYAYLCSPLVHTCFFGKKKRTCRMVLIHEEGLQALHMPQNMELSKTILHLWQAALAFHGVSVMVCFHGLVLGRHH